MVSSRIVVAAVTVAATLGTAAPALAGGAPAGPLVYPSLVNERLVRVQAALDRATASADEHQPNAAAATLMTARVNLKKAWTGAQYVIAHAPAPPPANDFAPAFHAYAFTRSGRLKIWSSKSASKSRKARTSQDLVPTGPAATIYDTGFAVLSLQHRMATVATGLIDTAHSTLLSSLSTSLFTALNGRDQAITYIKSIYVPAPPVNDLTASASRVARARGPVAHAADDPVVDWSTVMPGVVPLLDDELQQISGTLDEGPLRIGTRHVLQDAYQQDTAAEATINATWPPLPAGD